MAKKHLLWQLFLSYLFIVLVILITAGLYAIHSFRNFYLMHAEDNLKAQAILVREQILPVVEKRDFREVDRLCKKLGSESSTRITVTSLTGEVLGDTNEDPLKMLNHADRAEIVDAMNKGFGKSIRFSPTLGMEMIYVAVKFRETDNAGIVRTAMPISGINDALRDIYSKMFFGVLFIVLCAIILGLYTTGRITRPIIEMEQIARDFAEGNLDQRVPLYKSELGALAKSLNKMARQLDDRIKTITKQRNELEAILTNMNEGVIAVDSGRHIVSVNRAASELMDIEPEKAYGKTIEEVIRNVELLEFVGKTLDSDKPLESEMLFAGDSERFFRMHGASLPAGTGKRIGALIVLTDMTRMRRLENIRRDFVSNVSHELRTPVTSIQGFVEALRERQIDDPEKVRRYLDIIAKHSERLNAIIEDLLSLSRLEQEGERREITFEKVVLKPVLAAAIELSGTKTKEKEIQIELDCPDDIEIKINSVLLEQAVLNLIDNAVKYSPARSEIKISVTKTGNDVSIAVRDNGCGIETKHLERIFERFYVVDKGRSRKLGGTGLGLSIVKHIAQVHGGFVTVKSQPGAGSAFTIYLPVK